MESPFTIAVYDKAFARKGWVGDPVALTVTPRHNVKGTATLTVDSDHRRLLDLTAPGARVVIDYFGQQLLSGPCRLASGKGPGLAGQVTFTVEGDFRLLHRILGWPVPGSPIGSQTAAYDVRTGPAETVVKAYLQANAVTRLGLSVTIAPDLGRGATITASLRMHPLYDRLFPAVDQAGIGVTVRQSGTRLLVDCYTPATHPRTLSEASGVVQDWEWSRAAPEVTRVVVGDQGEATSRTFTASADAARESEWGDVIEVFRDARDTDDPAVVTERITETLTDGAPKAGLKMTLAETSTFRYGNAVRVGDRVRLEVGPGVVVEDVLREAVLSWTRDGGLEVTPVVGDRSDDPDRVLARAVASLARGVRNLTTR